MSDKLPINQPESHQSSSREAYAVSFAQIDFALMHIIRSEVLYEVFLRMSAEDPGAAPSAD